MTIVQKINDKSTFFLFDDKQELEIKKENDRIYWDDHITKQQKLFVKQFFNKKTFTKKELHRAFLAQSKYKNFDDFLISIIETC